MKLGDRFKYFWLLTGFLVLTSTLAAVPAAAQSSAIEGSWKLVSRTLPDGAMVMAPNLQGMLTFANGYRHISVVFRTPDGKFGSFSALAKYVISETQYTETLMFSVFDNPASGPGVDYQTSGAMKIESVQLRGPETRIKAPFDPVTWSFNGDNMKAISDGGDFEDNWERVN